MKRKQRKYSIDDACSILQSLPKAEQTSNRLRLMACALARLVWPLMDFRSQLAVEVAEEFARCLADWPDLIHGVQAANDAVKEREEISFEREITDEEAVQEHAAWSAWGVTRTDYPWLALNVTLEAVANTLRYQDKSESETYRKICEALREALTVPVCC